MGVTTSGIRWPEPTDPINQGALAMRNLAEDVTTKYGRGMIGRTVSGQVDINSAGGNIMATTLTLTAQRWLRVSVNLAAVQITAATSNSNATIMCNGASQTRLLTGAIALNDSIIINGEAYYLAAAGAFTTSVSITGLSAGGALRFTATQTFLTVSDVGGPAFGP